MPVAYNGNVGIHYQTAGEGRDGVVAFVGNAGFGAWQWSWQQPALVGPYTTIVPEGRGCGRSDAPPDSYSVSTLVDDLDTVLETVGLRPVNLVAAGLGALVALRYMLTTECVRSLVVLGGAASAQAFDLGKLTADPADPDAIRASLEELLSSGFRESYPDEIDRIVRWRCEEDAGSAALAARLNAFEDVDISDQLHRVTVPTLVLCGSEDAVCRPAKSRALAEGLPRGEFHAIPDAGHLVGIEASRPVNDRVVGFLAPVGDR